MKMAQILKTIMKRVPIKNKLGYKLIKMKKQLLLLSVLFIGMTVFGQKSELRTAERAIKSNEFNEATTALNQAEGLIEKDDTKLMAWYLYLKGMVLYQNGSPEANISKVAAAFKALKDYEQEIGKTKYTDEVNQLSNKLISSVAQRASTDYQAAVESKLPEDYAKAAKGFEQVYLLSPADTTYLDNAALLYNIGADYKKSIALYEKLLDLNYTGIKKVFIATNKDDGEDVEYDDEKSMNLQVKLGIAINPRSEFKESRRSMVFKNLAQNYAELESLDKAIEVLEKGRQEFPKDYDLLIDEANLYYRAGKKDKFKELLEEAIALNPTEPTLYYNVGVMNMEQKNIDEAIKSFEKAIELKPDYGDAYNNIGAAIIDKANPIIEEMNKSLSDFNKYDKLQEKQFAIYKEAIPYYEKAYELNPTNVGAIQTLKGIYENLGMTDTEKYKEINAAFEKVRE